MLERYFIGTAAHLSPQTEPTERYNPKKGEKSFFSSIFILFLHWQDFGGKWLLLLLNPIPKVYDHPSEPYEHFAFLYLKPSWYISKYIYLKVYKKVLYSYT